MFIGYIWCYWVYLSGTCRFEVQVDGCAHKLVIKDAQLDDTADYTVTIGDASCQAHLEVEEIPIHFIVPLQVGEVPVY